MNSDFNLAVHALVYLACRDATVSSDALAENICTNPARVRKVMARLGRAGLAEAREGSDGGFRFSGDAAAVTLADVADALAVRFVEANWRSGAPGRECPICTGMAPMMDEIYGDLNAACRAVLAQTTLADIAGRLVGEKGEQ